MSSPSVMLYRLRGIFVVYFVLKSIAGAVAAFSVMKPYAVLRGGSPASLAMFSLGYLIASLAPNARVANIIGMVLLYPMLFLSGAGFPLELLPDSLKRVSNLLPLTYVVKLLRGLWFGKPLSELWLPILVLGVILIVCSLLAARFFRWE